MDGTKVILHIIVVILPGKQSTQNSKHWVLQPNQLRDTVIPVICAVDPQLFEDPGDVHGRGYIFKHFLGYLFHETQSV